MGRFAGEAAAALVFLIGYLCVFCWMMYAYSTKRYKWRSRWSLLFMHVCIRVASQGCGVAFGVLGFTNTNVFLAYLILGAEGYFSLVLCAFRFLISWHQHNLPNHESWLEPRGRDNSPKERRLRIITLIVLGPLAIIFYWRNPMVVMHTFLILANAAIITGGSYLAGVDLSIPSEVQKRLEVSKIARTTGQTVFLACNFILLFNILATMRGERQRGAKKNHSTLILLLIAWFPLIVRGIFGVLQAGDWSLSYYNFDNYNEKGFTSRFLAIEYILGVLTEWLACIILNMTYYTSRNDPSKGDIAELEAKQRNAEKSEATSGATSTT